MAKLRELKRHLKSIETVGQVAGAMRSASSAKYAKLGRIYRTYNDYAESCEKTLRMLGEPAEDAEKGGRTAFVLIASNRGLSGGYNSDLFAFADARILPKPSGEKSEPPKQVPDASGDDDIAHAEFSGDAPLVFAVNRKAIAHCREKEIETAGEFTLPDIPSFEDAEPLFKAVFDAYESNKAAKIVFLYQRFRNAAVQIPTEAVFLPESERKAAEESNAQAAPENGAAPAESYEKKREASFSEPFETLVFPDKKEAFEKLTLQTRKAQLYRFILEAALGSQAAMMMAMRAAYDNARESGDKLRIQISRERQAAITSSVIETASGNRKEE